MTAGYSWHGRTIDHYITRGGAAVRCENSWWALVGNRCRGPLRSLDAAMEAVVEMIEAKVDAPPAP